MLNSFTRKVLPVARPLVAKRFGWRSFSSRVAELSVEHQDNYVCVELQTDDGSFQGIVRAREDEDTSLVASSCEDLQNQVARLMVGIDPTDQSGIELLVRESPSKAVRLATSIAGVKAGAAAMSQPVELYLSQFATSNEISLPIPIIGGLGNRTCFIPFGATNLEEAMGLVDRVHEVSIENPSVKQLYDALMQADLLGHIGLGAQVPDQVVDETYVRKTLQALQKYPLAFIGVLGTDDGEAARNVTLMSKAVEDVLVCPVFHHDTQREIWKSADGGTVNAAFVDLGEFASMTDCISFMKDARQGVMRDIVFRACGGLDPTIVVQLCASQGVQALYFDTSDVSCDVRGYVAAMVETETVILSSLSSQN